MPTSAGAALPSSHAGIEPSRLVIVEPSRVDALEPSCLEDAEPSRPAGADLSLSAATQPSNDDDGCARGLRDGSWRSQRDGSAAPATDRRRLNWWVEYIYGEWFWATVAWERRVEAAANGWATERAEYVITDPAPRLRDFMIELSPRRAAERAEAAA